MKKRHKKKSIITNENRDMIIKEVFADFQTGKYTLIELAKKHNVSQSTITKYISQSMYNNQCGTCKKNIGII